jgi:hypothetical protein
VVTVNSLSTGLDEAQAKVLEPLTGVGTDMSVSRPIDLSSPGTGGFPNLSAKERQQLQAENGGGRFGLRNLGKPGEKFSRDDFVSTAQLSFPEGKVAEIRTSTGCRRGRSLTLNSIHIEGRCHGCTDRWGFRQPVSPEPCGPLRASTLRTSA